jgi:hypothetical protein
MQQQLPSLLLLLLQHNASPDAPLFERQQLLEAETRDIDSMWT